MTVHKFLMTISRLQGERMMNPILAQRIQESRIKFYLKEAILIHAAGSNVGNEDNYDTQNPSALVAKLALPFTLKSKEIHWLNYKRTRGTMTGETGTSPWGEVSSRATRKTPNFGRIQISPTKAAPSPGKYYFV